MKIYITEDALGAMDFFEHSEGRYSLRKEGQYTQGLRLKFLGDIWAGEEYHGVFSSRDPLKIFILNRGAETFRQIDGWAPSNL